MRIAFVTPYVPSRIRTRPFNLIRALSTQHEIYLISLQCDEYEKALVPDVEQYCAEVHLIPLTRSQAYTSCLRALPSLLPLRVAYYQSAALAQRVRQVIRDHAIDVVHGELIKVVPALQAVLAEEHVPCLYDAVDCITSYLDQQHQTERNPLKKAFSYSELYKMRRYEGKALAAFDQVIVTSDHDRDYLQARFPRLRHTQTIANGVDTGYFAPGSFTREKDSLVFCAKLDYFPNAQAILHFHRNILPLIWKRRPQVRLTIVGNNPPQTVRDLAADSRITVTGFVPDIRPHLGKSSLALAPLLVAAGIQNKVLEAMAAGTPVVATPQACKALPVQHGKHLLIAQSEQSFAEAIELLLDDEQVAQRLSLAGRAYVEEHHSWTVIADRVSSLYQEMAASRTRQGIEASEASASGLLSR